VPETNEHTPPAGVLVDDDRVLVAPATPEPPAAEDGQDDFDDSDVMP
jgi:hypothetical protein